MKLLHGLFVILGIAIVVGIVVFIAYWNGNRVIDDMQDTAGTNTPRQLSSEESQNKARILADLEANNKPVPLSPEAEARKERILKELEGNQP